MEARQASERSALQLHILLYNVIESSSASIPVRD
jgi:hypothetical protein